MWLFINGLLPAWRGRTRASRHHAEPRVQARDLRRDSRQTGSAQLQCVATSLFLALLAIPAHADPRDELAQARHELLVSEQVLARVSGRVDAARADPATAPQERKRLDEHLARVRDLVELNRERVRSLEKTTAALPAGPPAAAAPSATTTAEDVTALEMKLGGSLADFDQLLLEEARKARTRAPTRASAAGYSGAADGDAHDKGSNASKGDRRPGGKTESASSTPSRHPGTSGTAGSPGSPVEGTSPGAPDAAAAAPPDVGDGNDDDIVARQIRRAAETEPDPELRKKLWDEYRKYKGGKQG